MLSIPVRATALAFAVFAALPAGAVRASVLDFSYNQGGFSLTGQIEGALESDGNTFDATSLLSLNYGTTPLSVGDGQEKPVGTLTSWGGPSDKAIITLNGASENFVSFDPQPFQGNSLTVWSSQYGDYIGVNGFGGRNWNSADWHASIAPAAPELSTWAMMLLGFTGLAFAGYQRNKAATQAA